MNKNLTENTDNKTEKNYLKTNNSETKNANIMNTKIINPETKKSETKSSETKNLQKNNPEKKKSILITNDDGIYAGGIQALSRELISRHSDIADIAIIAPDHERSAIGHAITMHRPLRVEDVGFMFNGTEYPGRAVNGTPADCVKLGVEALLPGKPDLVISGINRGSNLGTDVIYSGTVSAAVEGIILDVPSVAISYTGWENPDYVPAAEFISNLLPLLLENPLPAGVLLNINVPAGDINGAAITMLGDRRYRNAFDKRIDPRGKTYYWLAGTIVETTLDRSFDVGAIRDGYISVTPINLENLTRYDLIDYFKESFKESFKENFKEKF